MNIQELHKKLMKGFEENLSNLLFSLSDLDKQLETKKGALSDLSVEYSRLEKEVYKQRNELAGKHKEISDRENDLIKREITLQKSKEVVDKATIELGLTNESIKNNLIYLDELSSRINKLNSSIENLNKTKLAIEQSIEVLLSKLHEVEDSYKIIEVKHNSELNKIKQQFIEISEAKAKLEEELAGEKEEIKQTRIHLTEREKLVNEKEMTVRILAARYVKLFGDKGISATV